MSSYNDEELKRVIRQALKLEQKAQEQQPEQLDESYVVQAKTYDLKTELLSDKTKQAHQALFEKYVEALNSVSAKLDSADRSSANSNDSSFRSLKIDEMYNLNAAFLHAYYFENISDLNSNITMDSLSYIRLARDFGTFEDWQKDFIACALSSRNGWVATVYNGFLKRFINVAIDSHNINVPFFSYPVIVINCGEHAYYRDYLSDRKKYVFAMMKQLNWDVIENRFKRADMINKVLEKPLGES